MDNNGRLLPDDDLVAKKPLSLCGRSKFFVSTARREILGGRLHRTALPPTLQGFFYGDGVRDYLPCKNYGRFARLPEATPASMSVVDPSLSFLSKALPENRHIFLIDACNGLLLLGYTPASDFCWPEFAVCNPSTQQWVPVPSCVDWVDMDAADDDADALNGPRSFTSQTHISLLFDPAVSSHFHVLIFWNWHLVDGGGRGGREQGTTTVHAYSSETGEWRNSESGWSPEERRAPLERWRRQTRFHRFIRRGSPGAFVDGVLYLNLAWCQRILQVDTEGKTRVMLRAPAADTADAAGNRVLFVGRSQGRLHCVVEEGHHGQHLPCRRRRSNRRRRYHKKWASNGLFIWVLVGDMEDGQKWVLKHKVSREQLFGDRFRKCHGLNDYRVVAMHPDSDMVFFHLRRGDDRPMISYDFCRGEVRVVDTYEHQASDKIVPFAPYLSELFLGVLGGHK